MLNALTILLACQLAGETAVRLLGLALPGPVLGMVLLFVGLVLRGGASPAFRDTAGSLLQHLSLLFVPAGVGVIVHLRLIADEWLPISAALVGSTLIAIAVTALLMRALMPAGRPEGEDRR